MLFWGDKVRKFNKWKYIDKIFNIHQTYTIMWCDVVKSLLPIILNNVGGQYLKTNINKCSPFVLSLTKINLIGFINLYFTINSNLNTTFQDIIN